MSEESSTLVAIKITRLCLKEVLSHPPVLVRMATDDIGPSDVEDVITEILEYLDKTEEDEKREPEGDIIREALRLLDAWEKAGLGDYVVNGKYVDALRAKLEEWPHG